MWSRPPCPGVQTSRPLTSDLVVKSWSMFDLNMREACWQACGDGSKMEVSAAVESEKRRNSLMLCFPSIVSRTSLEALSSLRTAPVNISRESTDFPSPHPLRNYTNNNNNNQWQMAPLTRAQPEHSPPAQPTRAQPKHSPPEHSLSTAHSNTAQAEHSPSTALRGSTAHLYSTPNLVGIPGQTVTLPHSPIQ